MCTQYLKKTDQIYKYVKFIISMDQFHTILQPVSNEIPNWLNINVAQFNTYSVILLYIFGSFAITIKELKKKQQCK